MLTYAHAGAEECYSEDLCSASMRDAPHAHDAQVREPDVCIRQHTSAYVSIRMLCSASMRDAPHANDAQVREPDAC